MTRATKTLLRAAPILAIAALLVPLSGADAQSAEPVADGAPTGFELTLTGVSRAERGRGLTLTGIAHEVSGLADLSARAGLEVEASITVRRGSGQTRRTATQTQVRTGAGGRFQLSLDVADEAYGAPRLEIVVRRPGSPGRRFDFPLSVNRDEAIDLLTDRNRYQPDESVRIFARVRTESSRAPRQGRPVTLTLTDMGGQPIADFEGETAASGVVTAELQLPEGVETGTYRVRAEVRDGPTAQRNVTVLRRTVERILAEIELDQRDEDGVALVTPGGALTGRVVARTPSGTPIRGATVEVRVQPNAEPVTMTTEADGTVRFDLRAPTFLGGDVGGGTLTARITHAAYGTIAVAASYLMSRVRAVVNVTARGGALVPEVRSSMVLGVNDPRGRPIAEGTEVVVRGPQIAGGSTTLSTDRGGFVEVPVEVPRGAASRMSSGPCNGMVATTVEVEVHTDPPRTVRLCARVSPEAEVLPVVQGAPIVSPGTVLEVEVRRRASARGRPVLIEALHRGRIVTAAFVDGRASRGSLPVPNDVLGVVTVRARALRDEDAREPASEPGSNAFGVGAFDAVLVRPADAFSLSVTPAQPRYLVRERASIELSTSQAPAQGWAALLVRDQAAHGGEGDWELHTLQQELEDAIARPADEANARLVRAALWESQSLDSEASRPAPLEIPYWRPTRHSRPYRAGSQMNRGVMRDPIALREEFLRRGVGPYEMALERAVMTLGTDAEARARLTTRRGARTSFHRDAVAHLVATHALNQRSARTLGGEPITVAMLESADPGFSFDAVAGRVARQRLSKLLMALVRLTDPDDSNAQRASASLPPDRWLSNLVQLGLVTANDLVDPWGRPFVFRRVTGRRPVVAVSDRALEWELASPGPDGRLGSADDLNDPFARVVDAGTPYAVASGEESLMQRLSTLAPAQTVLTRMSQAYQRLALAAQEERRAGPVTASASEGSDEDFERRSRPRRASEINLPEAEMASEEEIDDLMGDAVGGSYGFGGLGLRGSGRGGGGTGEGTIGLGPMDAPAASPTPPPVQAQGRLEQAPGGGRGNRAQAMGAMIREDFPATLFFVGEVALDGSSATIEVPLADALTTYRLEAVAWSASGWTSSGDARVRVDQEALIDAPVPPFATAGDEIRLPVRIENRGDEPLAARVVVEAEGFTLSGVEPVEQEIPARSAREVLVALTLGGEGDGHLVVSLGRSGGEGIDAVRRPIRVLADARTARERRTALIDGTSVIELDVPPEASERGPGLLRLSVGARLFGDPESGAPLWAGWTLAMAGEPLTEEVAGDVLPWVTYDDDDRDEVRQPMESALALSASWRDGRLTDPDAQRALRSIGYHLPAEDLANVDAMQFGEAPGQLLLALAPVAQSLSHRPAVREDASRLINRLARLTSAHAAQATDAPTVWARAAAALAMSSGPRPRIEEMVRRTERHAIRVGDMTWIEPLSPSGREPRAEPTALMALTYGALGRRPETLRLLRALMDMDRTHRPIVIGWSERIAPEPPVFEGAAFHLAAAAAARLAPGAEPSDVRVLFDGSPLEVDEQGAVRVAVLEGVGRPGHHRLEVRLPEGSIALSRLTLQYGMPWDVEPRRAAPFELAIDGELGARDTRAGLLLHVQNRSARVLTQPVVELELPSGAELDEPTREALASHLRLAARQEGRTLILPLRPLAPGAWIRLPLRVRWAISGQMRGLGAVAYDARSPEVADVIPVAVLLPRRVSLADEGPEPEPPDPEQSTDDHPRPEPLPVLGRLLPEGA